MQYLPVITLVHKLHLDPISTLLGQGAMGMGMGAGQSGYLVHVPV